MTGGLDPAALAAVAAAATLLAAGLLADAAARRRSRFETRLARACQRIELAPAEAAPSAGGPLARLGAAVEPALAALARAVFARPRDREDIRKLLRAAGYGGERAFAVFAAVKLAGAGAGGALGWLGSGTLAPAGGPLGVALIAGGAVLGAILPEMALRSKRDARKKRLREALPDAIDLMVIAAYAGQSLDMAIDRVARELAELAPDMGRELSITLAEMQTRPDRAEALRRFGERLDIREAQALATTLVQTIRYGAPFTESLRALGGDLRRSRMIALEERGAKLPALLTLPLIVFILPAVFVVVAGPAVVALSAMFAAP